jgi:tryptophan synthase alpha chain
LTVERLDTRFARCAAENRAAFVAYLMAGDPDAERSMALLRGLPGAGADVIELGFPFSDPMAEGPPIQRASLRSLEAGTTLTSVLELVRRLRAEEADTPLILMGYLNPVLSYGYARFAADAAAAGVDGLLIVDCPPEEAEELADALDAQGLALVRLAAPTTDDRRLPAVVKRASGFVYYVSVAGVTGVKSAAEGTIAPAVARIRAAAGLPVAVGFGIRTPEQAAAVARVADGVVVGSALVDTAADAGVEAALAQASDLAQAVRNARR